jgi:hypothetical protein
MIYECVKDYVAYSHGYHWYLRQTVDLYVEAEDDIRRQQISKYTSILKEKRGLPRDYYGP